MEPVLTGQELVKTMPCLNVLSVSAKLDGQVKYVPAESSLNTLYN